jgi:hypothetical protein
MTDCENCGTPSVELVRVRRVYLTPESWDTPASRRVLEEPEAWCLTCISLYPADPAD